MWQYITINHIRQWAVIWIYSLQIFLNASCYRGCFCRLRRIRPYSPLYLKHVESPLLFIVWKLVLPFNINISLLFASYGVGSSSKICAFFSQVSQIFKTYIFRNVVYVPCLGIEIPGYNYLPCGPLFQFHFEWRLRDIHHSIQKIPQEGCI